MASKTAGNHPAQQNGGSLTRVAARRFIARWRRYNKWQDRQFESLTASEKLRQCAVLHAWVGTLREDVSRRREEQELRNLWGRIRRAYRE